MPITQIPPPPEAPSVVDHGALTGLGDNDHPQYALDSVTVKDGDTAGGVLSGTFPNPTFSADQASQAELDAHLNDTVDAHDASAVSFAPSGPIASTTVQAAIIEAAGVAAGGGPPTGPAGGVLAGGYPNPSFAQDMATQTELNASDALARNADNLTSGTVADARVASTIARDSEVTSAVAAEATLARNADNLTSGTVADARIPAGIARDSEVATVAGDITAHIADSTDAHVASAIGFTPSGLIVATNVQGALVELDTEKATSVNPTFTGQILAPDGTAANPGIGFSADPDTGIRRFDFGGQFLDLQINGLYRLRLGGASTLPSIFNGNGEATLVDGTGILQLGASSLANLGLDANEIQARAGGAAAALDLNPHGGAIGLYGDVNLANTGGKLNLPYDSAISGYGIQLLGSAGTSIGEMLSVGGATWYFRLLGAASGFTFASTTGATIMRILDGGAGGGSVGMGTPSPAGVFHVLPNTSGTRGFVVESRAGQNQPTFIVGDSGQVTRITMLNDEFRVYNLNSSFFGQATDSESMLFKPVSNAYRWDSQKTGTGTARGFDWAISGNRVMALSPAGLLTLDGTGDEATLADGTGVLQIGTDGQANLAIDANEIQARFAGASALLNLQPHGGDIVAGGGRMRGIADPVAAQDAATRAWVLGQALLPNDNVAPATVAGVAITPGVQSIFVKWTSNTEVDMANGFGTYLVEIDTSPTFSAPFISKEVGSAFIAFTGLAAGVAYSVRVKAKDAWGTLSVAWSTTATGTTLYVTNSDIAVGTINANVLVANSITAAQIAAGTITATEILAGTITTNQIAANTITAADIQAGTITSVEIQAGTIVASDIAAGTITTDQIAAETITALDIATHTITALQIAAGTITTNELLARTIQADDIQTGTITSVEIAADTITAANIAAGAITTDEILAGTIVAGDIATGTITSNEIAAGTITASDIQTGTITSNEIAANTITAADIQAGTITTVEIAANTITAGDIQAGTITTVEIAAGTIVAGDIAAGTITGAQIAAGTITAGHIQADTIDASHISADSITTSEIAAHTIQAGDIQAGTITATEIATGTITAGNIAAGTITSNEIAAGSIVADDIDVGSIIAGELHSSDYNGGGFLAGNATLGWNIDNDGMESKAFRARGTIEALGPQLLPNPKFDANITGWGADIAGKTWQFLANPTPPYANTESWVTWSTSVMSWTDDVEKVLESGALQVKAGASPTSGYTGASSPVEAGLTVGAPFIATATVKSTLSSTGAIAMFVRVVFQTSGGATVSTVDSPWQAVTEGEWIEVHSDLLTVPATAARCVVSVFAKRADTTTALTVGDTFSIGLVGAQKPSVTTVSWDNTKNATGSGGCLKGVPTATGAQVVHVPGGTDPTTGLACSGGDLLYFSFKYQTQETAWPYYYVLPVFFFYGTGGVFVGMIIGEFLQQGNATTWTPGYAVTRVPANAVQVRAGIGWLSTGGSKAVWIDDASLAVPSTVSGAVLATGPTGFPRAEMRSGGRTTADSTPRVLLHGSGLEYQYDPGEFSGDVNPIKWNHEMQRPWAQILSPADHTNWPRQAGLQLFPGKSGQNTSPVYAFDAMPLSARSTKNGGASNTGIFNKQTNWDQTWSLIPNIFVNATGTFSTPAWATGLWWFYAKIEWLAEVGPASGRRGIRFNGSKGAIRLYMGAPGPSTDTTEVSISHFARMAAGDNIWVESVQTTGANLGYGDNIFQAVYLGGYSGSDA